MRIAQTACPLLVLLLLLLLAMEGQAQWNEDSPCTTAACRRNAFLLKEREKLYEMQLDLLEMLQEIQQLHDEVSLLYVGLQATPT